MKATLFNAEQMPNPAYHAAADKTDVQPFLTLPAGSVIEDADAWMLCAAGKAAPADDECRQRYDAFIGAPKRIALIAQIRQLSKAAGVNQLDKKTKAWLDHMRTTYARELAVQPAAEVSAE